MAHPKTIEASARALRDIALQHADVDEGIACEGTAIEKRTFRVRNKAFVFLGAEDVMLKLGPSLAEASERASAEPARFNAGSGGWVTARFSEEEPPPLALLERWIAESYALFAAGALSTKKTAAKKTATRKTATKKAGKAKGRR